MPRIAVKTTGWEEAAVAFGIHTPRAVLAEVRATLLADMQAIRPRLVANVRGGVLGQVKHSGNHKQHGKLARSIKAVSTIRDNVVRASAASRFFVGRLWEDGFTLRPKGGGTQWSHGKLKRSASSIRQMPPRKWAEPVTAGMEPRVIADVQAAIVRGAQKAGF